MKKFLLLLLIPLVLAGCVKKEMLYEVKGQVNGIVIDDSNNPVSGATVTLGNRSVLTDSKGYFVIDNLQVGGNPKYQIYIEKDGYTSQVQEVAFSTTVNVEGTDDADDSIPLNNSVVSVKVTLGSLVDLKGKLYLPAGLTLNSGDTVTIKGDITVNSAYTQSTNLKKIEGTVDGDLNFTLKNVPKYGTFTSGTTTDKIISALKISLYVNGSSVPTYSTTLTNLDLTKYAVEKINGRNTIDLNKLNLSKLYKVTGTIYKNSTELASNGDKVVGAIVVLLKSDGTELKRVVSNSLGVYEFSEVEVGENYQLKLANSDIDGDGDFDYFEKSNFEKFSIVSGQTGNKTMNLWFDSVGAYSLSGTLYAGNKEEVPVASAIVGLYSSSGLIYETRTDSNGEFTFNNIKNKDVYIVATSYDSDSNGVNNFIGYESGDATTLKTKVSYTNSTYSNITGAKLYMKVNSSEPNYSLKLTGGSFFSVNSSGNIYGQSTINTTDSVVLYFNKELTQTILDSLTARKVKIVTLTNLSTSASVSVSVSLDGTDKKKLVVNPTVVLDAGTYRIQVSTELNSTLGYNYGVSNTINTDVLTGLTLTVE